MVASLLGISSGIPVTDATDALALAICHIHGVDLQKRLASI
jgi:Holliday junction resolvasome RuvABC endonuclease subunit